MVFVTFCFAFNYRLRKQSFAPKRHEAFGVEVFGMKCPKTHTLFSTTVEFKLTFSQDIMEMQNPQDFSRFVGNRENGDLVSFH